ncbi:hypothetical protein E2C01_087796 [Portunus trituberculatus]|uniref:Uncharacterized protein n=1 Tax=Portunus trituberculatus TaxID=210409 RepID=A0A5B7J941_PORTR|nr:hypothetical protein [Portunus trituberculatus]
MRPITPHSRGGATRSAWSLPGTEGEREDWHRLVKAGEGWRRR